MLNGINFEAGVNKNDNNIWSILMQIHKKRIKKEDGRYLIFYTFTEEEKESKDARTEMESNLKEMGNSSHPSPEQDL